MKSIRWRLIAPATLLLLAAIVPSASFAVADVREDHAQELADFDARVGKVLPTAAQKTAVKRLRATATWNRFGTPQTLVRSRGTLATGLQGSAYRAARTWLAANKSLFRLSSLAGLNHWQTHGFGPQGRAVLFRQTFGRLVALPEGLVTVALRKGKSGWSVVSASSSLTGDARLNGRVRLSPREALFRAARNVGDATRVVDVERLKAKDGWTLMRLDGVAGPQRARLIAVPTPRGGVVPAYQTIVTSLLDGADSAYESLVDARNGRILRRSGLVDHLADNPRWKVFPAYPIVGGSQYPWNYPSTDIREIWCWMPAPSCDYLPSEGAPPPKQPWDVQPPALTSTFTTDGNNARSAESWDGGPPGQHFLPGPTQYMPVSPTRDYIYPWTNVWFETLCHPDNYTGPAAGKNDIEAATTNLFVQHNRMHDWSWWLGFNEQRWNSQNVNYGPVVSPPPPWHPTGPPTLPNDAIIGDVQEGARFGGDPNGYAARDNANMVTFPDGGLPLRPITNMYLWQPLAGAFYAPCVDGDYDGAVIGHEYGHMIENRMIGKGATRAGHHAGAMGESFGDLNGMEYLNEYGFVPVSDENRYSIGAYATSNKYRAIRNYGMNFPFSGGHPRPSRYPFINPLNFSDMGYDIVGQQVHANGEIWSATNFDIRRALIAKYGQGSRQRQRDCADGKRPPEECPGNRRWMQLYYDAMVLMPFNPTMIDARNMILAADLARFGGANQRELWWAFSTRGYGQSTVTTSNQDAQPKAAFDSPHERNAQITFRAFAKNEGNAPVLANVYVGHYEARVSPIADTNPATTGTPTPGAADATNLDNVALFAPRMYEFVAQAAGYGHLRFRTSFRPGETRTIDLYFATNWASVHKGAVAAGDGTRHMELIDDTERSNWHSGGAPVQGRQVTIKLGGAGVKKLTRSQVSAYLTLENEAANEMPPPPPTPGTQNRFTALRQFELRGCSAGASTGNATCDGTNPAGWSVLYRSAPDFFPGDTPRPVAPELLLRGFDLGGSSDDDDDDNGRRGRSNRRLTHVQLVVLNNQCTGNTAYQGEQDLDPGNDTDCRTGNVEDGFLPRANDVRAAEVQVYTSKHSVRGASLADAGGDDDDNDDDDDDDD